MLSTTVVTGTLKIKFSHELKFKHLIIQNYTHYHITLQTLVAH